VANAFDQDVLRRPRPPPATARRTRRTPTFRSHAARPAVCAAAAESVVPSVREFFGNAKWKKWAPVLQWISSVSYPPRAEAMQTRTTAGIVSLFIARTRAADVSLHVKVRSRTLFGVHETANPHSSQSAHHQMLADVASRLNLGARRARSSRRAPLCWSWAPPVGDALRTGTPPTLNVLPLILPRLL
jgi:hypothetical protein